MGFNCGERVHPQADQPFPHFKAGYDLRRPRTIIATPAISAIALAPDAGSISGTANAAILMHCIPIPNNINENAVRIILLRTSIIR